MKPNLILAAFGACALLAALSTGCGNRGAQVTDLDSQRAAVTGAPAPANVQAQINAKVAQQRQASQNARSQPSPGRK